MATALIHLDPKQKRRLARRAKLRGKSFSQGLRNAVNLYLDLPVENEKELSALPGPRINPPAAQSRSGTKPSLMLTGSSKT